MKRCPTCNRTYTDLSLNFCLEDGTPLAADMPGAPDPNATIRYPAPRDTAEPPPTEIYRPPQPTPPPPRTPPPPPPPQWSPPPAPAPRKKSNAIWWVLGGVAALAVIGGGLIVMIIALASLSSTSNTNNFNTNVRDTNRNSNVTVNTNTTNANVSVPPSGPFVDDFSEKNWRVGVSQYGRIWYDNDEYHMSSKERTYMLMCAPSDDYSTENANIKVTARTVDGSVPAAGFGLMVHCSQTRNSQLEHYAFLIYPGDEPEYEIIMQKGETQTPLVTRTKSDAIASGSSPNRLEIRVKGADLAFYVNGQFLTRITDTENYRRGRVGFYTSDVADVAFDDLEISR